MSKKCIFGQRNVIYPIKIVKNVINNAIWEMIFWKILFVIDENDLKRTENSKKYQEFKNAICLPMGRKQ